MRCNASRSRQLRSVNGEVFAESFREKVLAGNRRVCGIVSSKEDALRAELVLREEQAKAVQEKLMELKRTVHLLLSRSLTPFPVGQLHAFVFADQTAAAAAETVAASATKGKGKKPVGDIESGDLLYLFPLSALLYSSVISV